MFLSLGSPLLVYGFLMSAKMFNHEVFEQDSFTAAQSGLKEGEQHFPSFQGNEAFMRSSQQNRYKQLLC